MSIWIISGINGKGKTSLLTEFGQEMAFDYERTRAMKQKLQSMNDNGFNLTIPEHSVASWNRNTLFGEIIILWKIFQQGTK